MDLLLPVVLILVAYLLGSFSSAVVICRLMGLPDPRTQGSGNPGATNVLRSGGKKAAALTLFFDVIKGLLPVLLARMLTADEWTIGLVALAAFIGHLFPVFFNFRGGKGVATGFGCLLGIAWPLGLCVLATWLLMAFVFRYSSLSALVSASAAPLYAWLFTGSLVYTGLVLALSVLLIWRHRSNIRNLLQGKEDKIGHKKNTTSPANPTKEPL